MKREDLIKKAKELGLFCDQKTINNQYKIFDEYGNYVFLDEKEKKYVNNTISLLNLNAHILNSKNKSK